MASVLDAGGGLPVPAPGERWAFFLDVDGTLVELREHPSLVRVAPALKDALARLRERNDGAVALVSGRSAADLDRLFAPQRFALAGLHGQEIRRCNGAEAPALRPVPKRQIEAVRSRLEAFARGDPRLVLEDKGGSLALHYRRAPERRADCLRTVRAALEGAPALELLEGKMVLELKPRGVDKGAAITALMREPCFRDRIPVFAGDDTTDEYGFVAVRRLGGKAIKVGPGATHAQHRVPDVGGLTRWLDTLAHQA